MTAEVVDLRRSEMRREADRIAAARTDAISSHPATRSKQVAQVERQQVIAALVAAVADERLAIDDERDLPLIVDVLLRACPQSFTQPETVAQSIEDAAGAWGAQECDAQAGEAALIVTRLAAGTAQTTKHGRHLGICRQLADWLLTAAAVAR